MKIGDRVLIRDPHTEPDTGWLVEMKPFKARDGSEHIGVKVIMENTENYAVTETYMLPDGRTVVGGSFMGNITHLQLLDAWSNVMVQFMDGEDATVHMTERMPRHEQRDGYASDRGRTVCGLVFVFPKQLKIATIDADIVSESPTCIHCVGGRRR